MPFVLQDLSALRKNVIFLLTPTLPQGMWKMMQQEEPEDFVLATGEVHSVREFVEAAFKEVRRKFPLTCCVTCVMYKEWNVTFLQLLFINHWSMPLPQIGREIYWEGSGVDEVAKEKGSDAIRVTINPKYYRPAEVVSVAAWPGCCCWVCSDIIAQ